MKCFRPKSTAAAGPFTLVPPARPRRPALLCGGVDGDGAGMLARMGANADAFSLAANRAPARRLLGRSTLAHSAPYWADQSASTRRGCRGERIALIAEATRHAPIGAQRVEHVAAKNIATLLGTCPKKTRRRVWGSQPMLGPPYHKGPFWRLSSCACAALICLEPRQVMAKTPLARDARAKGLSALYALAPVRRMLMWKWGSVCGRNNLPHSFYLQPPYQSRQANARRLPPHHKACPVRTPQPERLKILRLVTHQAARPAAICIPFRRQSAVCHLCTMDSRGIADHHTGAANPSAATEDDALSAASCETRISPRRHLRFPSAGRKP